MSPTRPQASDSAPTGELHRTLSLWQVALAGTGTVLGAGVYALIGPAAGRAGGALWMGFLLAGLAAGATAYVYARFSRLSPRNSPEFQYTALAFGPHVGFVAGWLMLAADLLAAATVALGFGGYLSHLTGWPIVLGAILLFLAVAAAIFAGISESILAGIVLSLVEVAGLVFVATVGIPFWPEADFLEAPLGFDGVVAAASLIFFAFLGFDEIGNLTEEMRDPQRDLPRALFVTMVASTSIYILVALSVVAVVDWQALASAPAPLALVMERLTGQRGEQILSVVALAATGNTVLLLLVSGSRSIYGMASSGVLPAVFARVGSTQIPSAAAGFVLAVACLLVFTGSLSQVAELTNGAILASFMLVNLSLVWVTIRRRPTTAATRPAADGVLGLVAFGLCGWLFLNSGLAALSLAAALAGVGALVGRHTVKVPNGTATFLGPTGKGL